nr:PEP-CTERM sorting domain-containing protein [uncultured Desulfobulbus sp.]
MKKLFAAGIIVGAICCSAQISMACSYYDLVYVDSATWIDGGVKHEYFLYKYIAGQELPDKSWNAVNTWVNGGNSLGDYLATITSASENSFIMSNLLASFAGEIWLGGYQTPPTEPNAATGWTWVTAEPWGFTYWGSGEPNDAGGAGAEQYLGANWNGYWNDEANLDNIAGFLVEKTSPVPEPATMLLFGTGLIGLSSFSRKKRQ